MAAKIDRRSESGRGYARAALVFVTLAALGVLAVAAGLSATVPTDGHLPVDDAIRTSDGGADSQVVAAGTQVDPAQAEINVTERTIEETTVAPGGSTTVEVVVDTDGELGTAELIEIEDQFSPAFADVTLVGSQPGVSGAESNPENTEFVALWDGDADSYTLQYEVTLPTDAALGDTFDISGTVSIGDDETALPDGTITAGFPEETSVSLEPRAVTDEPGEQTTFDVVVEGGDEGIGSYAVNVSVGNTDIGTITAVEHAADPETDDSAVAGDGSWGRLAGDLGEDAHDAQPRVVIGQIVVETGDQGQTTLPIGAAEINDSTGTAYTPETTGGAKLTVEQSPPFDFDVEVQQDAAGEQGEDVPISAFVTNTADEPASGTVQLVIDADSDGEFEAGEVVVSKFEEFDADESREIALLYQDVQLPDGSYGYVAQIIEDDQVARSTEGTLTVGEPEPFEFGVEIQQEASVEPGADVDVGAVVTNTANQTINDTTVELLVDADGNGEFEDSEAVTSRTVDFDAGETRDISLTYENVQLDLGEYDYVVRIGKSGQSEQSSKGLLSVVEDAGPPAVVGDDAPRDLNGDGTFEDVDGDEEFDIFDVQVLFNNLESDVVQNNPGAFNFNGDENPEEVTIFDIQALFNKLQNWDG